MTGTTAGAVGLNLAAVARMRDTNGNKLKDSGDMLDVEYVLRNSGSGTTERLTVTDSAVKVLCKGSSLAAGAQTTCIGSRKVTLADMNRGVIVSSAVAQGQTADGQPVTAQARGISVKLSVVRRLAITQQVSGLGDVDRDGRLGVNDHISYSFVVSNVGTVSLSQVAVLDAHLSRSGLKVRCGATALKPGASTSCTAGAYRVTAADVIRGEVQNFAAATATTSAGVGVRSNSSVTAQPVNGLVVVVPPVKPPKPPRPHIDLRQWVARIDDNNRDTMVDSGDGVVFGFQVTNSGGSVVSRVAIDDARLARLGISISCSSQSIQPGRSVTCTSGVYTATNFSLTHGVGRNFASATALTVDAATIRSNSTVVTLPVGVPTSVALDRSSSLAFTGSPIGNLLQLAGGLFAAGFVLSLVGRKSARNNTTP